MASYPPEKAGQPGSHGLPTRTTQESSAGYVSDDDAIPEIDTNDTVGVLTERLQAWKHACGYLENYIAATEKMQKSQAKEYDRVLKSISDPLREGHHFDQKNGGIAGMFENMRTNTQALANLHLETSKNLGGTVMPILTRLHAEIKNKSKELTNGAGKAAKAVAVSKNNTQKHIELLGQHTGAFDAAGGKVESQNDPYVLGRGARFRLHKQVLEENNSRNDLIAVQKNMEHFEAHIVQVIQQTMGSYLNIVGGQADRQRAIYNDIAGSAQKIPTDFEWLNFLHRSGSVLVDESAPPREVSHITYANQDHASTKPLIAGTLERKSRGVGVLTGYKTGYYAITPAKYLHQFDSDDDFKKDPSPELSLYLPDCAVGAVQENRFNIKGKDTSKGKVGSAFQIAHELSFKAHTATDAKEWHRILAACAGGSTDDSPLSPSSPQSSGTTGLPDKQQPAQIQTENLARAPAQASAGATPASASVGTTTTPSTATSLTATPSTATTAISTTEQSGIGPLGAPGAPGAPVPKELQ